MSESLARKEAEIAATRERLAGTIDRIQDKLTVTGIIDEVMGSAAAPRFDSAYDKALGIVRRNPVPVLIVAGSLGWLLHRIGRRQQEARAHLLEARIVEVPVTNDGRARIYDPDLSTTHPSTGLAGPADGLNPTI
jgi:hypothetical protein